MEWAALEHTQSTELMGIQNTEFSNCRGFQAKAKPLTVWSDSEVRHVPAVTDLILYNLHSRASFSSSEPATVIHPIKLLQRFFLSAKHAF